MDRSEDCFYPAFLVHQSSPALHSHGNVLTYNEFILRTKAFDVPSGKFVAPVRGLYFFSFTATKRKDAWMGDLDFYGDRGFLQTFCPAQHVQHAGYDFATTCSNQIVIELEQGEKLYTNWNMRQIQVKPSTAEENAFFEKGISFTGFLISSVIHSTI